MSESYLEYFPKPLLDDLIEGRTLPIVGAGFSKNAVLPSELSMPLWTDLGKGLLDDLPNWYEYTGAIDSMSAYAQEFSRVKLIEELSKRLFTSIAKPGKTHQAFCSIPFDIVMTTNFDFLLEHQYNLLSKSYHPILEESQLSMKLSKSGVNLIKFHGDFNHPNRMVVIEEDYDLFLTRFPLFATYIANLLITRSALMIGYSFDDPDFRQLWKIINERLGNAARKTYSIAVDASQAEIAKFERRGVKVINLPGDKEDYSFILEKVFNELKEFWTSKILRVSEISQEDPLRELSLPKSSMNRLCYFAVPLSMQYYYKENIYSIVEKCGLVPVMASDIIVSGESRLAMLDALIERALVIIGDETVKESEEDILYIRSKAKNSKILIFSDKSDNRYLEDGILILNKPADPVSPIELLVIEDWLEDLMKSMESQFFSEPKRLYSMNEYKASVVSAFSVFELRLRNYFWLMREKYPKTDRNSFIESLKILVESQLISDEEFQLIIQWNKRRNELVHFRSGIDSLESKMIITSIEDIIERIEENKEI
ncbi:SIR2-like domain protein [Leptospira santarosai str. 2000027870]|uniref:SIR2 family NAD-dependent protein deacylase n=1 Tax=Leptospira santarosai TaxID=28183 RepID=UPI0002BD58CB|nr:SIR2 family protein [Leptospira santarosai]EMM87179.1 SIR2-like domain protein [Leptospira santarosai str. 2000027870]